MSLHRLRISATALGLDSSLRMQVSTVRAAPLGLLSIQHMASGKITLTVNYFWQAPTTRWCSTTQCNLLQKLYALWSLSTRLTLLLRGVRRGTDTKDGLTTLRGPLSLRKSLHHLLHDDVQRTLNATRGNSHTSLWCTLKSNGVSCAPPPRRAGPCPEQVYALFLGCLAKVVLPLLHRHQVLLFSLDQLLAVGVETMSCKHVWRF